MTSSVSCVIIAIQSAFLMKSCSIEGCVYPIFRTDKNTRKGYCTSHWYQHSTDIDKRSPFQKHMDKQKGITKTKSLNSRIRGLANTEPNKIMKEKHDLRSDLLMLADMLFGKFIKKRDADENGFITCICCGNQFHLDSKDEDNKSIVQPLHYIDRDVYSLRFSEINVHAGCCYCNKKMHDSQNGLQAMSYRGYLIHSMGIKMVEQLESEKRNINRLSHSDIQSIIEKYKTHQ